MGDDRHGGVRDLSETTFRLSQSCCRPEGDQKRSDRGEKFLGYFSLRTSVVQQPETFVQNSNIKFRAQSILGILPKLGTLQPL